MDTQRKDAGSRNRMLIVIALALTVATIIVLKLYASSLESKYKQIENPVQVLVSINPVAKGEEIKDLGMYVMPKKHVRPDTILVKDPLTGLSNVELVKGAKARHPIAAKQILLWSDIVPRERAEERGMLARVIRPGYRAVTVQADVSSTHGGLLRAGDRVDVLCTMAEPQAGEVLTKTIVQNLTVLAVNGEIEKSALGKGRRRTSPCVTLEVTPEQAELIVFARLKGDLSLIARSNADTQSVKLPGKGFWDIFEKPEYLRKPAGDTVSRTLRLVKDDLKGIRSIKVERVGDKIVIAGVVYTDEEIARVKACAKKYAPLVQDKSIPNPRTTTELRRGR